MQSTAHQKIGLLQCQIPPTSKGSTLLQIAQSRLICPDRLTNSMANLQLSIIQQNYLKLWYHTVFSEVKSFPSFQQQFTFPFISHENIIFFVLNNLLFSKF